MRSRVSSWLDSIGLNEYNTNMMTSKTSTAKKAQSTDKEFDRWMKQFIKKHLPALKALAKK